MMHPDSEDLGILRFIEWYWNWHHISPSIDEIAENVHKPKNFVFRRIQKLDTLGYLQRRPGKARGIVLRRTAEGKSIDMGNPEIPILGYIAAGEPIPMPSTSEPLGSVVVSPDFLPDPSNVYALRVKGDSMIDVCINNGDLVFIRFQETAENGDLIAARLLKDPTNPTTTLKRYQYQNGKIWLKPENRAYAPIPVKPGELEIQGIVVRVMRDTERGRWN